MNNFSCPYLRENVLKMVKCFWSQQEFFFFFRFRSEICLNHPENVFFSWMINENEVKNRNWKKKPNLFCHSLPRSVWINRNPNHKSLISDFQGLIQTIINYVAEQKKIP